jgi:hypothetical protein
MAQFKTLHVFGYGETQLIASSSLPHGKVDSTGLTHLDPLVTHIKTFKPEDVTEADYHVIHVFKDDKVKYLGKGDNTEYSFEYSQLDTTLLDNLTDEVVAALPTE